MRWNLAVAALSASFGLVSLIVRGVDLDAAVLVFYRCAVAVPAIGLALVVTRRAFVLPRRRTSRQSWSASSRRSSSRSAAAELRWSP